jgi:peptide/nickel transport system ATP-binding protein
MERCRAVPTIPLYEPRQRHAVRCVLYDGVGPAQPVLRVQGRDALLPPDPPAGEPILDVRDYRVWFPIRKGLLKRTVGYVKAVDGVSFTIPAARTLALVGESGSGKTTVGKGVLQLLRNVARIQGTARLMGQPLDQMHGEALRNARRNAQIVFQDPFASLNPRLRVNEILEEGVASLCPELDAPARGERVATLLERVGLRRDVLTRYPHEFSGGQRQRLVIARALAVEPKLIIADEPTSALDVSVQAQILNLLKELQRELGVAYLFITHNFGVVEYLAHDIAVMKDGKLVEAGTAGDILDRPRHDYTQALLAAVPRLELAVA